MALTRPNQTSFSGGEYSPTIYARVDIAKYRSGLKTCRNFITHPSGGASNRPGTRFVAETKDSTKTSIVKEFIFSQDQTNILEFGDTYVRFFTNGDSVAVTAANLDTWVTTTDYLVGDMVSHTYTASTVSYIALKSSKAMEPGAQATFWDRQDEYEITSPWLEAALTRLRFESSADVIYVTHPDYETRTLSRFGLTDWRIALFRPIDGPFRAANVADASLSVAAVTGNTTMTAVDTTFSPTHVDSLWKLTHFVESNTATTAHSGTGAGSSIKAFTTWRVISHGTWTGTFSVQKSADAGTTWTDIRTFSSADDFNANTSGTEDVELNPIPFLVRTNMTSHSSGTANVDLTTDSFFQDGIVRSTTYTSSTVMEVTVLQEAAETGNTTDWAEGAWSNKRGWPAISRFFQDRLVFANTYANPQTLWMSVIGLYNKFRRSVVLLDTDGITVNIPSRQVNEINGLTALNRLIVLTKATEWSIGTGVNGILAPTSINIKPEGYRGSSGVDPVIIGNEVIYMQANGKVVRNLGFSFASDSFTGGEVNILAKHLFDKWTITDLVYQQDPDTIIWALRDDGVLLGCTYMKEQDVVGWHRHDTNSSE